MFVIRELLNRDDIIKWAVTEGFQEIVPATALHVTVGKFHDTKVWRPLVPAAEGLTIRASQRRILLNFGGVIVLAFGSGKLSRRHAEFRGAGMTWLYRDYTPHVSFALDSLDLRDIRPFDGRLRFGPEIFKPDPIYASLPAC
ncbi:phage prohead protein [Rhizobium sp. ZPR3]|uniref:Anti-CBASS protein Acb1 n=2 Tax=unclassified Rhizobium TaxID=2613769 RepID=A0AAU7SS95_9HYPH